MYYVSIIKQRRDLKMYENVYCHECGNLVCQGCGCCQTFGCENQSCPDSDYEEE